MWRLKIAEGGNDPHIDSTNNFLGRQTWEFDPDAGTLEERAEVEEARQNFWRNRNEVKPSSDLLWKFQVYIHTYKFTEYVFIYIYIYIYMFLCLAINFQK
jgi:beta-amyrin synthase